MNWTGSIGCILAAAVGLAACSTTEPIIATHLGFETQPNAAVAAAQSLGSITVAYLTAHERRAVAATANVQISLISASGEGHLAGTLSAPAANGIATFTDLSVDKAGTAYRLVAKTSGFDSVLSQPFDIAVGAPAKLRFESTISAALLAGQQLPPVAVSVTDAGGNLVPTATTAITLSGSAGDSLYGTTTISAVNGTAVFSDVSVQRWSDESLVASAPNLASATSNPFLVSPLPCDRLAFFTQPSDGRAGVPLPNFSVYCADRYGNPPALPPGGSMSATIAFGNNPTGATLSGPTPVGGFRAALGFNDVIIDKPGTGYTLIVSSPGLASATSKAFNVSP